MHYWVCLKWWIIRQFVLLQTIRASGEKAAAGNMSWNGAILWSNRSGAFVTDVQHFKSHWQLNDIWHLSAVGPGPFVSSAWDKSPQVPADRVHPSTPGHTGHRFQRDGVCCHATDSQKLFEKMLPWPQNSDPDGIWKWRVRINWTFLCKGGILYHPFWNLCADWEPLNN